MPTPDRQSAVKTLLDRFEDEPEHVEQVMHISMMLFDELQPLHRRGPDAGELLRYGALLHDLGWSIAGKKHHKHSQALIMEHLGEPFSLTEKRIIACLARYHRKALPHPAHPVYDQLDETAQDTVCRLGALLRIADGLDRSHSALITELGCAIGPHSVTIEIDALRPPRAEVYALGKKTDLFRKVYRRGILLNLAGRPLYRDAAR